MKRGFTLIELLIVVAIIAILAAIAVPNFLEAQIRSKVSRVKTDMRTISIALEAYAVDHNGKYPYLKGYLVMNGPQWDRGSIGAVVDLTTPIAYLSSVMINDPFYKKGVYYNYGMDYPGFTGSTYSICLNYINVWLCRELKRANPVKDRSAWFLLSMGPDQAPGPDPRGPQYHWLVGDFATSNIDPAKTFDAWNYDPSNGTTSAGDIIRHP